ncbi:unnamed protein product [Closterium sp. NIES-53]
MGSSFCGFHLTRYLTRGVSGVLRGGDSGSSSAPGDSARASSTLSTSGIILGSTTTIYVQAHMDGDGVSRVLPALPHRHHPHVNLLRALLLLLAQHLLHHLPPRPCGGSNRHLRASQCEPCIPRWTLPLTTGAMAVYFVFLCWSAIMSEPPAEACKHSPSPDRMRRVALYSGIYSGTHKHPHFSLCRRNRLPLLLAPA